MPPRWLWIASLAACLAFSLTHVFGGRMRFLRYIPRSRWLSFAGGVAVAYVFVHLLPELAEQQHLVTQEVGGWLGRLERHVYLIALLGLATFYSLDRAARQGPRREGHARDWVFLLHLASYSVYNGLVGYLLLEREASSLRSFAFYTVAMVLHFVVNDRGLAHDHGERHRKYGRWILAVAPFAGWALGVLLHIPETALAALFAFLGGGVILNVLKEELPEDRESRLSAFLVGAALYTLVLLAGS